MPTCSRPLTALALTALALTACDPEDAGRDPELDDDAALAGADAGDRGDDRLAGPRTLEEEIAAADRDALPPPRPRLRADRGVCGVRGGPAAVDVDVAWSERQGDAPLRITLARPTDAEVSVDVAVVVDGETVAEVAGAVVLAPEAVERAAARALEGAHPWEVDADLDLDALGLADLDADRGMLVLIARVRGSDGALEAADRPLYLFFARDGGGVRLFDEATGLARGLHRAAPSLLPAVPEPGGEPAGATVGEGSFTAAATAPQHLDYDVQPYVSVRLCARHSVTYVDAGLAGEDYWTDATAARPMTGASGRVYVGGQQIWSGQLGDGTSGDPSGEGCTPFLWMPQGSYPSLVYDTGLGAINGNTLEVRVHQWTAPSVYLSFSAVMASGTYSKTGTHTSSVFPVYVAIAKAMRAHSGGVSGIHYTALTLHDDGSRYDRDSEEIRILGGDEAKKFLVVHEYGHAFGDQTGDGHLVGGECSRTSDDDDCSSGGSHGMTSIEWQSCAVNEGFAHFIAADTFNNHAQGSCAFRYWGSNHGDRNVDCEGSSSHVTAWMENMCEDEPQSGAGVELDWLRQFWDVHTNGGTTNMIPFMQWIRASGGWTKTTAYSKLNSAAQSAHSDIKDNWNGVKSLNGIVH